MAEAPPHPARSGGPLGVITSKAGPLPVWAWAALVVVAYFLYRRLHGGSSSTGSSSTGSTGAAPTDQTTYVPPFDAANSFGSGGIGASGVPSTVNNYYYGDTAGQQAAGGGTSPGSGSPTNSPPPPPGHQGELPPPSSPPSRAGIPATSGAYNWQAFQTAGHGL